MADREEELRCYFEEVDTDGDGYITVEELQELAFVAGANPTDQEIEEIKAKYMDNADTDGDCRIDLAEFCRFMSNTGDPSEELRGAFTEFDRNGDGTIDCEELKGILCQGGDTTEEDVQAMISEFDKDGSGSLDINEFVNFMTQKFDYQG